MGCDQSTLSVVADTERKPKEEVAPVVDKSSNGLTYGKFLHLITFSETSEILSSLSLPTKLEKPSIKPFVLNMQSIIIPCGM